MSERKKIIYNGKIANVTDAAGVSGILLWDGEDCVFRIPDASAYDGFRHYKLRHEDLSITISKDELALLYDFEDFEKDNDLYEGILDHRPEDLGKEYIDS